ncbi:pyridoxamine 5'-phosphate oxidase family protein [Ferviditalea candida]|uniref:Pyridoxamine 5'-phosphate oxidase family protein n=1 Tax=Ferviditalea candida TaxID=3108399 RepID=A0ABU5ZEC6_9BACL|nr:pyridoxamine 5'-phosphate oxidase family protein [Paenibacillaceae bacterium T2]
MAITDFDFGQIFNEERIGLLTTYNKQSGKIHQNAVSWIKGASAHKLRIAVSTKSDIVTNIEEHPQVTLSFFYDQKVIAFQSEAKLLTKQMEAVPFPLTLIEVETEQLQDIMFYGAAISQEPAYVKTYNLEAAKKLDQQVYASMALSY